MAHGRSVRWTPGRSVVSPVGPLTSQSIGFGENFQAALKDLYATRVYRRARDQSGDSTEAS